MSSTRRLACFSLILSGSLGLSQANSVTANHIAPAETGIRDGQHDFDFEIGTWKTHLRRLVHPLSGSTQWVEFNGTSVVSKIWDGRANLVELEVDGPGGHIEGLSLRLYDPNSHQWSLNFASSKGVDWDSPPSVSSGTGGGSFMTRKCSTAE